MEYINLHVSTIDSAEFKGASPEQQGTFLCALRYLCGQEDGDTLRACRTWTERRWQTVVGVDKKILLEDCGLWEWKGDDLVLNFYPIDQERVTRAKRRGGRLGNRRRWSHSTCSESESDQHSESHSDATSDSDSESITKRNETETKRKVPPNGKPEDSESGFRASDPEDFPEIKVPGEKEFITACTNRGIPAWRAALEYAWRSERPAARWPTVNWMTAVTWLFEKWRSEGAPQDPPRSRTASNKETSKRERGEILQALEVAKKSGAAEDVARLQEELNAA